MNRLLVFHYHDGAGTNRFSPSAFYIDADYEKVAVRIYAEGAPNNDATMDIFDDGVSIFNNKNSVMFNPQTSVETTKASDTTISLPRGVNSDDASEDFNDNVIENGSWVYCDMVNNGGGRNFTVQLELRQVSEGDEED